MLKMYDKQDHAGDTPDFWEDNWAAGEFEKSVSFCVVDPLRPLFEKYLRPDSLMLEGGCGMGNYVTYYSARGIRVIGLDFAQRALKTLKTRQPTLDLCGGDVSRLPFADKTFDLYYSGGVVEHFEGGAEASLIEARRVLKDDGVLLISVPYYSPLRRAITPFRSGEWRRVAGPVDEKETFNGKKFFQYAYRIGEFEKMLSEAGLRTIEKQGYAVLWGLSDLSFRSRNGGEFSTNTPQKSEVTKIAEVDVSTLIKDRPASLLKRLVVNEDDTIPVLGLGVKAMRWAASNMTMYVCRRNL